METKNIESFSKIVRDLIHDLDTTFPEYKNKYQTISNSLDHPEALSKLHEYCIPIIAPRFFDILYQNEEIFDDAEINTSFLPDLDFSLFFKTEDISDNTKKVLWKYLQVLLFTLVGDMRDKDAFGDTANLFAGIDESDLQEKMKEAFDNMENLFDNFEDHLKTDDAEKGGSTSSGTSDASGNGFQMPDLGSLHGHLQGLLDGKIGSLAKELAAEMTDEFKDVLGGESANTKDLFKNLVKNPKKIKDLIQRITQKIEQKMKNGNISRDELMKEASDIMGKMKEFGGKDEMMNMMKGMAKSMGGKKGRFNMGAFESMAKQHEQKERLRKKLEERRNAKIVEENNKKKFVIEGDKQEKTDYIHPDIMKLMEEEDSVKKEKPVSANKKKKKKKKN